MLCSLYCRARPTNTGAGAGLYAKINSRSKKGAGSGGGQGAIRRRVGLGQGPHLGDIETHRRVQAAGREEERRGWAGVGVLDGGRERPRDRRGADKFPMETEGLAWSK